MAPDKYQFGVEIEIIAEPHTVRDPLAPALYYQKLAASLKKRGLKAKADDLSRPYRKHSEEYDKGWWITKDGSLQGYSQPDIAFEAVSPILSTNKDWEREIETFWEAQKAVFHMPRRSKDCGSHIHITPGSRNEWTMKQLKNIAVGILVYENEIQKMLPSNRRNNAYCPRNSQSSDRLRNLSVNWPSSASASTSTAVISLLKNIESKAELCTFMQKNRYVLFNFANIVEHTTGTIEFRGGRGLRGPERTKRWIAFTVALIDLFLHECLYSENRGPQTSGVEDLYKRIRDTAKNHGMKQILPKDYRVLNESTSARDRESEGSDLDDSGPIVVIPKDTPTSYDLPPPTM